MSRALAVDTRLEAIAGVPLTYTTFRMASATVPKSAVFVGDVLLPHHNYQLALQSTPATIVNSYIANTGNPTTGRDGVYAKIGELATWYWRDISPDATAFRIGGDGNGIWQGRFAAATYDHPLDDWQAIMVRRFLADSLLADLPPAVALFDEADPAIHTPIPTTGNITVSGFAVATASNTGGGAYILNSPVVDGRRSFVYAVGPNGGVPTSWYCGDPAGLVKSVTPGELVILPFKLGQGLPAGTTVGNAGGSSLTGTAGHISHLVLYNRELTAVETTLAIDGLKLQYGIT